MKKGDMQATEEVYQMAKDQSAQEIAELKENLGRVHGVGVMAGRVQAYKTMQLMSEFLTFKQIAQIIDSGDYKLIPGVTSIDSYFEQLGIKGSTGYNNLKIARALEAEEVQLLERVGFTRRDLLNYSSLPEDARLEIREGKVINLESASKEEIKDLIEQVLIEQKQLKEDAEADTKAKDRVLKAKEDVISKQEKELAKLSREAKKHGYTPEEEAFLQRMNNSRIMIDGFLLDFDPERNPLPEDATTRMKAAYMETIGYFKRSMDAAYDTASDYYGDAEIDGSGWQPPQKEKLD